MKRFFNQVAAILLCATAFTVFSCEDDISDVGSGLIDNGSIADVTYVDVVSYNTNNDSIRSDEFVLQSASLGVFEEPVFGRTKAKFITQARLNQFNPNFGANAEMDSVILSIPVFYQNKEADIEIDTTYLYLGENETPTDTATIRISRTYKLDSIYGQTNATMNLQVREVAQYLYSMDSTYYSNPAIASCQGCPNINEIEVFPNVLGVTEIKNKITTHQVKKKNASGDAPPVAIQVKLDKDYFKQKFIDNQNSSDLNDNSAFIRNFFRGIELSVQENQGFIFNFNPTSPHFNLTMYYHYDNPEEGDDTHLDDTFALNFSSFWGGGYNVQLSQFEHANRSSQFVNAYTNPNTTTGDSRIYLAGMDGTKAVIKLNQEQLSEIRNNVLNNDWAIVGAELNLHIDDSYNLKTPPFLFAWNQYKDGNNWKNINFTDVSEFFNSYPLAVQFNPQYDYSDNPKTYTIRITDYVKSIVERNEVYEDGSVILSMGNFLLSPNNAYSTVVSDTNPFYNNRAFNPYRVVLHGNNSEEEDKKLRLKIYYTKK
ncbi:MAG: DUF4270 domain-containing protein [Flavobacteriaceae bacterium]|jgi:hypothetical protein|nr:DUF4270 domain-containing protein [Flavobacteriaceae bacterium]